MLTSEKVYEMAAKLNNGTKDVETKDSKAEAKAEENKVETAAHETANAPKNENLEADTEKKSETEPAVAKTEEVEESKAGKEPDKSDNTEKDKTETVEKKNDKTPTKQEQIDYAFKKQKAKYKKLEERYRAIEEENRKLKSGLTLEDFGNKQNDYVDYLVNKKMLEKEQSRIHDELVESKQEEFNEIYQKRISECFPDKNEQAIYNDLVKREGNNFLAELDREDPDGTILGYLDDCDVQPIMLRILMTNEQYLDNVLSKRSSYSRFRALEDLENRIKYAQAEMAKRRGEPEKKEEKPAVTETKPTIPVIGSVTKSDTSTGNIIKDYNSILHELNQKRYGR